MTFMRVPALIVIGAMLSSATPVMQKRDRVVKRVGEEVEVVEVTSVEVAGKPVETGQKFTAGDDWLRGLKIRGKNSSDKGIVNIIVEPSFEQPGLEDFVYSVAYGVIPRSAEQARAATKIKPQESIDIFLSESIDNSLRTLLAERGYPDGVEAINISIGTVAFDDYTLWRHGKFLRPDPHHPMGWQVGKPVEK